MAVKQLIDVAVAEKVAALCTAEPVAERVARRHVNPVARTLQRADDQIRTAAA